jgi:crotonobetainyl-CoA:carnitine CoA-transferase CaiB-like acyl-CoA transferase
MRLKLLDGLKVIQVGGTVSSAFCGKVLADMGADVLMVEPPGEGNFTRRLPPYYEDTPGLERSVLHNWLNSNKRGITLKLQDKEGRVILYDLARHRDILIEGLWNNGKIRQGLNYDELKDVNPRLIITSITPFGRQGPYADYHSSELTLFSMSGFDFYLSSPVDDPLNTSPRQNAGHQVSMVAGLVAATATMWGVFTRERKGKGLLIDISEWEAFTSLLFEQTGYYSDGVLVSERKRDPSAGITAAGGLIWCLPCSDGWIIISPREDHQFKRWSEVMGGPEWTSREVFSTPEGRKEHAWEIHDLSASWTVTQKKDEVFKRAQEKKVPCFPISLMKDLLRLEQLEHRGFWITMEHPLIKGLKYPGLPMKTNGESESFRPAPLLGEHTSEVCRELGISSEKLKTLFRLGII